jgi:hypothetical protein
MKSTAVAPNTPMRTPAIGGPSTAVRRLAVWSSVFASPSRCSSSGKRSGSSAVFDANDGVAKTPTPATSTSSTGKVSIPARWSSGIAAISGARMPSQISIVRRAPSRVARPPPSPPTATAAASTASTTDIRAAEPVVVSTNHGSATQVICDPVSETISRARIPISARLRSRSRREEWCSAAAASARRSADPGGVTGVAARRRSSLATLTRGRS